MYALPRHCLLLADNLIKRKRWEREEKKLRGRFAVEIKEALADDDGVAQPRQIHILE